MRPFPLQSPKRCQDSSLKLSGSHIVVSSNLPSYPVWQSSLWTSSRSTGDLRVSGFFPKRINRKGLCLSFVSYANFTITQWYPYHDGGRFLERDGDRPRSFSTTNWNPMLVSSRQWTLSLLWQPWPCHPPLPVRGSRPQFHHARLAEVPRQQENDQVRLQ